MTNITTESQEPGGEVSLQDLLPTIAQVFLTILLGWLSGLANIFPPEAARGLNIFVGKYSLPSLVFISLATFDFNTVNFAFLLGIFLSKLQIFVFTIILEVIISRNLTRAAMFAMFCTQTNDFAMGVPLLEAVLGDHPYKSYLYLVAPISLVILNPIGFIILETGKGTGGERSLLRSVVVVLTGLGTNPLVVMTLLGILTKFIFTGSPPEALQKVLSKLGAAFGCLAPFTLGLGMVGKFKFLQGGNLSTLIIMMIIKCIISPLSCHMMVSQASLWLHGAIDLRLSNFSFLYGTFPPALGVMSYATHYQVTPELVSAGIVLCTAVSAPLMFLSAQILTILSVSSQDDHFLTAVRSLDYNTAIWSLVGALLTLAILLLSQRYAQLPHCFTTALLAQSLVAPLSAVLLHHNLVSSEAQVVQSGLQQTLSSRCIFSSLGTHS